jgi:hypothetical protein
MAAASVDSIAAIPADRRAAVHTTIDSSFSSAYRSVMLWLCVLSLAAAVVGAAMT